MITFNQWMKKNQNREGPIGEFIQTCLLDSDKPKGTVNHYIWIDYLKEIGAEDWEHEAFKIIWKEYEEEME